MKKGRSHETSAITFRFPDRRRRGTDRNSGDDGDAIIRRAIRPKNDRSALNDGIVLGAIAYAASHLGWLPTLGLSKPVWKQEFPEVAGELLRHVADGVATTAAFGIIEAM